MRNSEFWERAYPAMRFYRGVSRLVHACQTFLLGCLAFGSRLPCGSAGMFGVRFTPAVRFCWDVWRSVHACRAVLLECLAFGSRLPCSSVGMFGVRFTPVSFPLSGKERRLAVSCVPIPPWVGIAFRAFSNCRAVIGLCGFTSGLPVSLWRSRRGYRGRGGRETGLRRNEAGGAAFVRLCAGALTLQVFPRGVRWGLRAPKPAPKSQKWKPHCGLSGLSSFDSRRGYALRGEGLYALRGRRSISHYRRPARLRPMVGQVVLCCAAASESRLSRPARPCRRS